MKVSSCVTGKKVAGHAESVKQPIQEREISRKSRAYQLSITRILKQFFHISRARFETPVTPLSHRGRPTKNESVLYPIKMVYLLLVAKQIPK